MLRRFAALLAALLVGALIPLCSAAEVTKLQIRVTNAEGNPVGKATVVVRFLPDVKIKHSATIFELRTSKEGIAGFQRKPQGKARILLCTFLLAGICVDNAPMAPQGKIQVQVIAKGYQTFGSAFDFHGEEKTLEIVLTRPQQQLAHGATWFPTSRPANSFPLPVAPPGLRPTSRAISPS